jgi:hypothetical protein
MTVLDEESLRRPTFAGGIPIMLADGQAWSFPRPRARCLPGLGPGPLSWTIEGRPDVEFDLTMWLMPHVPGFLGSDGVLTTLKVGALVLLANYDLDPADAVRLLAGDPDDRGDLASVAAVLERVAAEVLEPATDDVTRAVAGLPTTVGLN